MPTLFAVYNLKKKEMAEEYAKYLTKTKKPGIRGAPWRARTLFLTGGRVSETLVLSREMFEHRPEDGLVIIRGMPVLKRFKKLGETLDEEENLRWITEPVEAYRRPCARY